MRAEVEDRARSGARGRVEAALAEVLARFEAAGQGLRRPLRVVLEPLGVPGFTETQVQLHVLHLQARAASGPWLPGLLARQVAHAALSDLGHPSHDPALLQDAFAAARERSREVAFLGVVGALNHHVRDVYADDLAARVDPAATGPFLAAQAEHAAAAGGGAAEVAVEAGYALGTLARRGTPAPPALGRLARERAEVRRLADGFASLHPEPEAADLEHQVRKLIAALP